MKKQASNRVMVAGLILALPFGMASWACTMDASDVDAERQNATVRNPPVASSAPVASSTSSTPVSMDPPKVPVMDASVDSSQEDGSHATDAGHAAIPDAPPGYLDVIEIKTPGLDASDAAPDGATVLMWWEEQGVAPLIEECHEAFSSTDCTANPLQDLDFGEYCMNAKTDPTDGFGRPKQLVDTTPWEANKCHAHTNNEGHPAVIDCFEFCKAQGSSGGACVPAPATCLGGNKVSSAKCECDT